MKNLKKQNNMLFKLSNKTITLHELNKINNTNKEIYDYSSSGISSIYRDLDYSDSSISTIRN